MTIDNNDDMLKVKVLKTRMAQYGLGTPVLRCVNNSISNDDFNQTINVEFYTEWIPTSDEENDNLVEYSDTEIDNAFNYAYLICKKKFPFFATPIYKTKFGVGKLSFSADSLISIAKLTQTPFDVVHNSYKKWIHKLSSTPENLIDVKRFTYDMNDLISGVCIEKAYKLVSDEDYVWLFNLLESKTHIDRVDVWMSAKFNDSTGMHIIKKNVFTHEQLTSSNPRKCFPSASEYYDGRHSRFWSIRIIREMTEDVLITYDLNCNG